jgi:hypothetical protein
MRVRLRLISLLLRPWLIRSLRDDEVRAIREAIRLNRREGP